MIETIIAASVLLVVGFVSALAGYAIFRLILPFMGLVVGFSVGFSLVQSAFGANVWSYLASIITALMFGVLFALLAYTYYTLTIMIVVGSVLAGAFAILGQAVGLREEGFVIALLSLTGAIVGGVIVYTRGLQQSLVIYATALFGVGAMMISALLLVGGVRINDLHQTGVLTTINEVVTSSWLALIILLAGTIIAATLQKVTILNAIFDTKYAAVEENNKSAHKRNK